MRKPAKASSKAPAKASSSGYSGTPLPKKLGIYPDESVGLIGAPRGFEALLDPLPAGVRLLRAPRAACDLSIWFPQDRAELARAMTRHATRLGSRGIWICWPKKSSGVASDLDENLIRTAGLSAGLVDFKVCAIDGTYSGLKLTRRKT